MAVFKYVNVTPLVSGLDLSSRSNVATIDVDRVPLDKTTFGSNGYMEYTAGLSTGMISLGGFWNPDTTDASLFSAIGSDNNVMILPTGGADAEPALFCAALRGVHNVGGKVGDLASFTAAWQADGTVARGTVLKNGSITSTTTGTIMQLGAVTAAQKIGFQIHVTSASGTSPTLDLIVQSAALVGFGSPTTRATFTQLTDVGSQTIWVNGAITDTYWRVSYTIGGTDTPTFATVVAAGICPL